MTESYTKCRTCQAKDPPNTTPTTRAKSPRSQSSLSKTRRNKATIREGGNTVHKKMTSRLLCGANAMQQPADPHSTQSDCVERTRRRRSHSILTQYPLLLEQEGYLQWLLSVQPYACADPSRAAKSTTTKTESTRRERAAAARAAGPRLRASTMTARATLMTAVPTLASTSSCLVPVDAYRTYIVPSLTWISIHINNNAHHHSRLSS